MHSTKADSTAIITMLNEHYAKGHPKSRDVVFVLVVAEKDGDNLRIDLHANTDALHIITALLEMGKRVHAATEDAAS